MSGAAIVPLTGSETYFDKYFGAWVIGYVGPVWQGASTSYKGGTAVVLGTSRADVVAKIAAFAESHDRLLATVSLADGVQRASSITLGAGALVLAGAYYAKSRPGKWVGSIVALLGATGLGSTYFIRQAAAKNQGS